MKDRLKEVGMLYELDMQLDGYTINEAIEFLMDFYEQNSKREQGYRNFRIVNNDHDGLYIAAERYENEEEKAKREASEQAILESEREEFERLKAKFGYE